MTNIDLPCTDRRITGDESLFVLDIERELAGPNGSSVRENLMEQFNIHIAQIEAMQRLGFTPEQFKQSESWRFALDSAIKCISQNSAFLQ